MNTKVNGYMFRYPFPFAILALFRCFYLMRARVRQSLNSSSSKALRVDCMRPSCRTRTKTVGVLVRYSFKYTKPLINVVDPAPNPKQPHAQTILSRQELPQECVAG